MSRDKMLLTRDGGKWEVTFKWGTSKNRDTYGHNICSAYVNGQKVGSCSGGGYDMEGTALEDWLAKMVKPDMSFYGLHWVDPNYTTPKEIVEREEKGEYLGLEKYQDYHAQTSKVRTDRHIIPEIDGGCGLSSILYSLGFEYDWVR